MSLQAVHTMMGQKHVTAQMLQEFFAAILKIVETPSAKDAEPAKLLRQQIGKDLRTEFQPR